MWGTQRASIYISVYFFCAAFIKELYNSLDSSYPWNFTILRIFYSLENSIILFIMLIKLRNDENDP